MQQTALAAAWLLCQAELVSSLRDFIPKSDLAKLIPKSRENDWVSLDQDTEFLPADVSGAAFSSSVARQLASSTNTYNPYASQAFVDGAYEYNGYQQAWRYLGFMIDCDNNGGSNQDDHKSGDQGTGEGCSRYVLWAAYVDLEYEGGGIGEYQYWDRWANAWDDSSCQYASNNNGQKNGNNNNNDDGGSRCAKMDCHLEDTHFSLLGIFKHKDYDEWMGQLFKHEGMCIWTDDEYSFMKNARKSWPRGCSISSSYYDEDKPIYYDLKPATGGDITVGLYTDTRCTIEYVNQGWDDPNTLENVVGNIILKGGNGKSRDNNNGNDDYSATLEESLATWDSAFDIFKICQPCIAYSLQNVGDNYYYYYGNDGGGGGGNDFDCYDDAGYTNVNQCMKFMAKTTMYAATYRDISLASEQGTLVDAALPSVQTSKSSSQVKVSQSAPARAAKGFLTVVFFIFSSFVLMVSLLWVRRSRREAALSHRFPLKQPLVMA